MNKRHSPADPFLKRESGTVVERQLRDGDPPETQQTLDRLLRVGYPQETAVAMIGAALLEEIGHMMQEQCTFHRSHFKALRDQAQ